MSELSALARLERYVIESTIVYRKGDVITHYKVGEAISVVSIDAFPSLPEGLATSVDCHFVHVGFTEALAALTHQEFYDLVLEAGQGLYATMTKDVWAQGPSYITIGAWIGDQTTAFRFMSCVQAHGLGHVITPATLGIEGPAADAMAGGGMVMLSGLKDPSSVSTEATA